MKRLFSFGSLALIAFGACNGDQAPSKGQLMLALQTDMSIPDDVSHVRIVVFKNGALKFDQKYRVGPNGEEIPATLGVIASDNPADTTEVRVLSYRGATVRTLNRVVTTVPQDRVATLRIPIQWLCDKQVVPVEGLTEEYDSSCENPEEACVAGECRKVAIESKTLPDFEIEDITGGEKDPTRGLCFDAGPCLDAGRDVVPDTACGIDVSEGELEHLNVGLRLAPGRGGICSMSSGACYIPLDQDDDNGWRVMRSTSGPARVALPKAVCTKLASGDVSAVRVSAVCATKRPANPSCGPWTSVGTSNPDVGPVSMRPHGDAGAGGGTHTTLPGAEECPNLVKDPVGPIAPDPEVDRVARLSLEGAEKARQLRFEIADACAAVALRITGSLTEFAGAEPTDAELEAACQAAMAAVPNDAGMFHTSFGAGYCRAAIGEQLSLESACAPIADCVFGSTEERCLTQLTDCDGTCTGACMPGEAMLDVSCESSCLGQCVGTCDGTCRGPGGNVLPSSDCMGECTGTCVGRCQGQCTDVATCEGVCRGTCEGAVVALVCEGALTLPACAASSACEHLAAATAALHHTCSPPSVFVVGQTPPEVAPAIADNLPRLLNALARAQGTMTALGYLQGAWAALATRTATGNATDRACLQASIAFLTPELQSLGLAIVQAQSVTTDLSAGVGSTIGVCTPNTADDPCASCMKASCCPELEACAASAVCNTESQCLRDCMARGEAPAICESSCGGGGVLDPSTRDLRDCQTTICTACGAPVSNACVIAGAGGFDIDDFDDGDTFSPFGAWRVAIPDGFFGSLRSETPGAAGTNSALGVAGTPDPGLAIDFTTCFDARASSELSFDVLIPNATARIPLTVRVRTIPNETPDHGGSCSGAQCGDYHSFTTQVSGGSFVHLNIPWGSLLDSGARPPDLSQIVGFDFIVFGGTTDQLVIDTVKTGAQAL